MTSLDELPAKENEVEGEEFDVKSSKVKHLTEENRLKWIYSRLEKTTCFDSPIDLNIYRMFKIGLPPLVWENFENNCRKMAIHNTGNTVLLTAKWHHDDSPKISGGPMLDKFQFHQIHFHWGRNSMEGSEHSVDNCKYPGEMHITFYNTKYVDYEEAMKNTDGVCIIAYFITVKEIENEPYNDMLFDHIKEIEFPRSKKYIYVSALLPLSKMIHKFTDDYFSYWGSVQTTTYQHIVIWLICRTPITMSYLQINKFRTLLNKQMEPLVQNFRPMQEVKDRHVFFVNPSTYANSTMLPASYAIAGVTKYPAYVIGSSNTDLSVDSKESEDSDEYGFNSPQPA